MIDLLHTVSLHRVQYEHLIIFFRASDNFFQIRLFRVGQLRQQREGDNRYLITVDLWI